jgi:hypothetical protein
MSRSWERYHVDCRWQGSHRHLIAAAQQFDRNLAGLSVGQLVDEHVKGPAIFLPGEELVPVDEIEERHRLLAQGMNDVPIIDDLIVPSVGMAAPTRQGHQMRPADEDHKTIVEETYPQPVANQAGWHGVEDLAQGERAFRKNGTAVSPIEGQ